MKVKNQPWKKRLKYENPLSPSLSAADARRLLHLYYSFRSTCTHRQRWLKLTRACDFSLLWVSLNQAAFLFLLNSCTCKIYQIINTITLCSVFYFCRVFFFCICICTESTESFYTVGCSQQDVSICLKSGSIGADETDAGPRSRLGFHLMA